MRDWLYVEDHCHAIAAVLRSGRPGETYNVGGDSEKTNAEVVNAICAILDEVRPDGAPHARLIEHVVDRPGHDRRYAIDAAKIARELGFRPKTPFLEGLRRTVAWYLENDAWVQSATRAGSGYAAWVEANYANRKVQP